MTAPPWRSALRILLVLAVAAGAAGDADAATLRVTSFGARCDGATDDTAAIQAAFNAAGNGDQVELPAGTCVYRTTLRLAGKTAVTVYGAGMNASRLQATTPSDCALFVDGGSTITIRDLQVAVPSATLRLTNDRSSAFLAEGTHGLAIHRVKVDRAGSAGIHLKGVSSSGVYDSVVQNTLADGVHVSRGSQGVTVARNQAVNTGDDSFSSIGYGAVINRHVGFFDNVSTGSKASGVAVEGSELVEVHRNTVIRSGVAGIRVASVAPWSTGRVSEVDVRWNTVESSPWIDKVNHSSILVYTDLHLVQRIHVRDNTVFHPQARSAFRVYGANGGQVRLSEIERNVVWGDVTPIRDCVSLESGTSQVTVRDNVISLWGVCQ